VIRGNIRHATRRERSPYTHPCAKFFGTADDLRAELDRLLDLSDQLGARAQPCRAKDTAEREDCLGLRQLFAG